MRAEFIILLSIALVGAGALALERADPDAVRVIAISACSLLIILMVGGLFMRARAQKHRGYKPFEDDPARRPPGDRPPD